MPQINSLYSKLLRMAKGDLKNGKEAVKTITCKRLALAMASL